MGRLVSVGNVIVDITLQVDAMPEPGGDVVAAASGMAAGGGLNTLVAARRDGAEVVFAGQYGTGPFGDIVRAALVDADVQVVQPGIADVDSGYCIALTDASAERTFITSVGAEGRLDTGDLARIRLREDDTVLVSGYGLAHPVNAAAISTWLAGIPAAVRVVFDPSPLVATLPPGSLADVLRRADVVSVNAREAMLLTRGAASLAGAAVLLAERVGGAVLVRDGAAGCWIARQGLAPELVSGFAVDAVDTNGAGDTHDGVLIAALSRGDDLRHATRRANAAAAIAVTRRGPATAPHAAEIDHLLEAARER